MPTVKNEKGEVVAKMDYTPEGEMQADKMVQDNPGYTTVKAPDMREQMYAGGGKVGYGAIGKLKSMMPGSGKLEGIMRRMKSKKELDELNKNKKK